MVRLSADEIACVKKLAELYEAGEVWVKVTGKDGQGNPTDEIGTAVSAEKRASVLGVMEHTLGIALHARHNSAVQYSIFQISPTVLQIAREIQAEETKEEEPEDIVELVKTAVRRNRVLAWALIAFFVLVGLSSVISLVNGVIDLLKKIGAIR